MLGAIFERFVKESPISVMVPWLMERVFALLTIDRIFEENASSQYTRELLFSSFVELMSLVVCGIDPSVSAAYRAKAEEMNVSRTAVYDKLNGVETNVSSAIVRETAIPMASLKKKTDTPESRSQNQLDGDSNPNQLWTPCRRWGFKPPTHSRLRTELILNSDSRLLSSFVN